MNNEFEPIPIENINELIEKTPTFEKYLKTPTVLINDGLYTISFDIIQNRLLVKVYSTKISEEVSHKRTKPDDPKYTEYNKTIDFARFIYDQIMKEVVETIRDRTNPGSHSPA